VHGGSKEIEVEGEVDFVAGNYCYDLVSGLVEEHNDLLDWALELVVLGEQELLWVVVVAVADVVEEPFAAVGFVDVEDN
jgi:hypothetical protein